MAFSGLNILYRDKSYRKYILKGGEISHDGGCDDSIVTINIYNSTEQHIVDFKVLFSHHDLNCIGLGNIDDLQNDPYFELTIKNLVRDHIFGKNLETLQDKHIDYCERGIRENNILIYYRDPIILAQENRFVRQLILHDLYLLHSRHIKVTKESFIEQCHFDPKSIEVGINSLLSRKFIDFQDNNLRLTYDGMNFVECNIFSLHFSNKIFLIAACHDDIYWLIDNVYRPIAEELNFSLVFQEKTEPKDTIHEEIWENIKGCKLIICDLTHSRPNCFIEFGYALALNRPMICCIEDVDGHDENRRVKVPFDVNNKNWHFWHREWISRENESEIKQKIADFKMELKKAIQQKLIILEAQSEI